MQNYSIKLQSKISDSFRCKKAAHSLDINLEEKSKYELEIEADLKTPFSLGVIVGNSGSGKTTLAKKMFGEDCFTSALDEEKAILDQFPEMMTYEECARCLLGMGLSSVTCWIRPVKTLSNGQKARAQAAVSLARANDNILVIDEWTSVVDRTVGQIMSLSLAKHARREKKQIVLCSCHYDILPWLEPDWIIDCTEKTFTRCDKKEWKKKLLFSTSSESPEEHGKVLASITI